MREKLFNRKVIVALDNPEIEESKKLISKIDHRISFYKVGLGSFAKYGFKLVEYLTSKQKEIFLDLKLYDIDNTIKTAVKGLSDKNISFLTINGDPKIINAAVKAKTNKKLKILAVTFLTNLDRQDLNENLIKNGDLKDLVIERANKAFEAGADGIIASAKEVSLLKSVNNYKKKIIVTPGIRPTGFKQNDQKRICTPYEAVKKGSDHIVIGRPIWQSNNPIKVVDDIFKEISSM